MKTVHSAIIAALILLLALPAQAKGPKGHLVIIGGGKRPASITNTIIELAGGKDAKILGILTASGVQESTAKDIIKSFSDAGAASVVCIAPTREQSDDPEYVAKVLDGITGIYFCGGQQNRTVDTLCGTLLHREMEALYQNGAVISGSSAGAAIMSDPMITGRRNDGSDIGFNSISANVVNVKKGLGFLKGAIVDQHFIKRSRENRLLSLALDNPQYVSFGIDESTAIAVSNGRDIKVEGESTVMVIEPSAKSVSTDAQGNYRADLKVKLLLAGDTYRIK